tara:strand:+ start:1161 stop:1355 length:195 start_codon:yes stop_codon:yes gene_type:complete
MIAEVLLQFQEYQFLFLEIINSIMDITGLRGYNIANIMIFILVQPILTLVFLILWLREKKKRYK